MKRISKKYISDYIYKQHGLPYRLYIYLKRKHPKLYLFWSYGGFNANTKRHWDNVWKKEGISTWRTYAQLFEAIGNYIPRGSRVLDIGCGIGILLEKLKREKQCECHGVDVSQYAINIIRQYGMNGEVSTLPNIPFKDKTFDTVTATEVIEHIKEVQDAIKEAFRVLKNDGIFIVSVPDDCLGFEQEDEHFHKFTKENLKDLLYTFGNIIELKNIKTSNGYNKIEKKLLAVVKKCQK